MSTRWRYAPRPMDQRDDLVSCLLDDDGSCRDLNFEAPTWKGAHRMLQSLGRMFAVGSVSNHDGQSPSEPYPASLASITRNGGSAVLQEGTSQLSRLQAFVAGPETGPRVAERGPIERSPRCRDTPRPAKLRAMFRPTNT